MRNGSKIFASSVITLLCVSVNTANAQSADSLGHSPIQFPSRLLSRIQTRTIQLNQALAAQTGSYLQKMARQERRIQHRLSAVDSAGAARLFAGSEQQYHLLELRMRADTGGKGRSFSGLYPPYLDSLQGAVGFLKQNPQLLQGGGQAQPGTAAVKQLAQLQGAGTQLRAFQAKMGDADQVKAFLQQRKQLIGQYLEQHGLSTGPLSKLYGGMNQQVYYYSQQLREYKEMWNNPDQLTEKALVLLNRFPAFQTFMKNNSMLGGLFHLPGGYGGSHSVSGLQTREQVAALVQAKTGGSGGVDGAGSARASGGEAGGGLSAGAGMDALQSDLQNAESQLDNYKSKLSSMGAGNGDMDMPNFKPNDQKTKTFWRRLEYGANFQTTHTNYYFPMVTDFGASMGYKLGHNNVIGLGASYKLGWGNGIRHIAVSNQGVGLRSFLQIGIKGSFSATGGIEYNYTTPFASFQNLKRLQDWTKSGLVGVTKTISLKNRVFKKTSVSLLWDFLSYQQVPQTQPILFRVGYTF
jgi:hypothetical protein